MPAPVVLFAEKGLRAGRGWHRPLAGGGRALSGSQAAAREQGGRGNAYAPDGRDMIMKPLSSAFNMSTRF